MAPGGAPNAFSFEERIASYIGFQENRARLGELLFRPFHLLGEHPEVLD